MNAKLRKPKLRLFAANYHYKSPFIADQQLRVLDALPEKAFTCLVPPRFRAARRAEESAEDGSPEIELPRGCQWLDVQGKSDREQFLLDPENQRPMPLTLTPKLAERREPPGVLSDDLQRCNRTARAVPLLK